MSKFRMVVFDWAGTLVDFGSFAPTVAFVKAFAASGVEVTIEEARAPMGLGKRDHIRAILQMPRIAGQWSAAHGAEAGDAEIDEILQIFIPLSAEAAAEAACLVPGTAEMVTELRTRGLKIGSTTGYPRAVMERVLPAAAAQGLEPDCLVCADDVPRARPNPAAMQRCFQELGVDDPSAVIKVDDTAPGIGEGVAVGCVTVGVALSGNYVGRTVEELAAMSAGEVEALRAGAADRLRMAGVGHVIDTVADLPALLDRLDHA